MNYYEHHLGDYARKTRHLTMLEHGAYRLLLDTYYSAEGPLPSDLKAVQRLSGARTDDEREAVEIVLREFFTLSEDGWRHSKCDEVISAYIAKQPAAEAKKENDRERQKRARDRRKSLFEELRRHGIVAPWDATTEQLEQAVSQAKSEPVTESVTRDNTATQSPITNHHSSEAKASDAPASPRDELFALVEPTAKRFGFPDKATRSLFGKAVKLAGGDHAAIVSLVRQALRDPPLELEPWLIAACTPKPFVQKIYGRNPTDGDDDGSQATSNRTDAALLGGTEGRGRDEPGFSDPGVGGLVQAALRRGA